MQYYALNVVESDGPPPPPDELARIMADVGAVDQEMREAGIWVFAGGFHPPARSAVVRHRGRDLVVTDGPYAEAKEHIGGFSIIKAPDHETALEWGRKLARATTLPVEVREFRGQVAD